MSKLYDIYVKENGSWMRKGMTGGMGGNDNSIVGTWVFNSKITMPNPLPPECYWLTDYTVVRDGEKILLDRFYFGEEYLCFYNESPSQEVYLEDVYVEGEGWRFSGCRSITILKEPSAEVSAWIRANAKRGQPSVYELSSVDRLPDDAVDGSMAIVEGSKGRGIYTFNDLVADHLDYNTPRIYNLEFFLPFVSEDYAHLYKKTFNAIEASDFGGYLGIDFVNTITGERVTVYDDGWSYSTMQNIINVTKEPDDEDVINLLNMCTAKIISLNQSLYTHENGEWVYKCEVA